MDSFLQIAELLFKERVSDLEERECWRIHVDIVRLLQQDSFDPNDLNNLEKMTKRWKYLMVKIYGGVADQQQATTSKKTQLKRKRSWTTKKAASMATMMSKKLLSFKFPNFKVAQHWQELIRFLSPPWVQDMRLWEQRHLMAKMTARCTNQINTELVILVKVWLLCVLPLLFTHFLYFVDTSKGCCGSSSGIHGAALHKICAS